jgi:hypothetical protein
MYAVFLIAKSFGKTWVSQRNILDVSATPSGINREWYVCKVTKTLSLALTLSSRCVSEVSNSEITLGNILCKIFHSNKIRISGYANPCIRSEATHL